MQHGVRLRVGILVGAGSCFSAVIQHNQLIIDTNNDQVRTKDDGILEFRGNVFCLLSFPWRVTSNNKR
jgi:hypothetical protein